MPDYHYENLIIEALLEFLEKLQEAKRDLEKKGLPFDVVPYERQEIYQPVIERAVRRAAEVGILRSDLAMVLQNPACFEEAITRILKSYEGLMESGEEVIVEAKGRLYCCATFARPKPPE